MTKHNLPLGVALIGVLKKSRPRPRPRLSAFLFIPLFFFSTLSCGCTASSEDGQTMPVKTINTRDTPLSIPELESLCAVPGGCGQPMECEGKMVWVHGFVDLHHVFDQRQYPQLDYEKFFLACPEGDIRIDVFVETERNADVFEMLHDHGDAPEIKVTLQGQISGVDMPTMGECRRGVHLTLTRVHDIALQD